MTNQKIVRLNEIGRMAALAERFAAEGQMNLNKTLEAIAYAQIRRASWNYRPKITTQTMQSELAQSLDDISRAGVSPDLIAFLETGQHALEEKRGADLLIEEAPDVFVCRTCGYAAIESAPEHCPDCGAWSSSFRKFVASFNRDNSEPDNPLDILSILQENADDIKRLAEPLSEEQLSQKPNANDWSIREHVAHFYDTQIMLDTRVKLMLEHDNPELAALAVYEFATDDGRHPTTAHEVLSAFVDKRTKCVDKLRALPNEDLWRPGQHPEFGQLNLLRQAAYLAYHEVSHLSEIEPLCAQMSKEN
jgi:predicted Zn-ribbon and HTH transcriptional regulator